MSRNITVVDYCGPQKNSKCGYCSQKDTCQSHGMWAHCMTVQDYQDLIDRGWRRSGQYCYKPNNKETCCPSYTIKCGAKDFQLSKSHKKLIKKFNAFLRDGVRPNKTTDDEPPNQQQEKKRKAEDSANFEDSDSALCELRNIDMQTPKNDIDIENVVKIIETAEEKDASHSLEPAGKSNEGENSSNTSDTVATVTEKKKNVAGPDPTKPLRPKAKILRALRKKEKLLAASSGSTDGAKQSLQNVQLHDPSKNKKESAEKRLEDFIAETPEDGRHKFKVKLVVANEAPTEEELNLYRRYQIGVHKDPPEKLTRKSFENFLVRSPLQLTLENVTSHKFKETLNESYKLFTKYQVTIHHDPSESIDEYLDFLCKSPLKHVTPANGPSSGYGSFHQQYWLDDRLIAVGVIDILPKCVSSVYFFYDPEYSFLSLGTYGTLREILFTQQLNQSVESLSEYYMGFYIHSCPKMRYKGKLYPSYLLCPEVYTWHLLNEEILKTLDATKYARFNKDPNAIDANRFNIAADINDIRLLVDYKYCMTYLDYKAAEQEDEDDDDDFRDSTCEYGKLVGRALSKRLYLCKN